MHSFRSPAPPDEEENCGSSALPGEWRRRRPDMSTLSACRRDMFKKRDFFDTSPGYVDAIDIS